MKHIISTKLRTPEQRARDDEIVRLVQAEIPPKCEDCDCAAEWVCNTGGQRLRFFCPLHHETQITAGNMTTDKDIWTPIDLPTSFNKRWKK